MSASARSASLEADDLFCLHFSRPCRASCKIMGKTLETTNIRSCDRHVMCMCTCKSSMSRGKASSAKIWTVPSALIVTVPLLAVTQTHHRWTKRPASLPLTKEVLGLVWLIHFHKAWLKHSNRGNMMGKDAKCSCGWPHVYLFDGHIVVEGLQNLILFRAHPEKVWGTFLPS